MTNYPILYTFRRCPYAIRARMALYYSQCNVFLREIELKNKPKEMIVASAKGTVPVLVLDDGSVIDESIDIMQWALNQFDPDSWMHSEFIAEAIDIIKINDIEFKPILDNYKYPQRSDKKDAIYYRNKAEIYLSKLNKKLSNGGYLLGNSISIADIAIFPFIRQFCMVDKEWFEQTEYNYLQAWLSSFIVSELFADIMNKIMPWEVEHETLLLIK